MVCVWATTLELSWGIMALRIILKNVKDWVYAHVKPEVSRWIQDIHRSRRQISSLTPNGDVVIQRRRAKSCGPSDEVVDIERSVSPISKSCRRTSRQRTRPTLPYGETAPEYLERSLAKTSVPKVRLNGLSEPIGDDFDDSSDEGYGSIHTRDREESDGEEEEGDGDEEESDGDEEKCWTAFICNDELCEDESDASYVPPTSEDESTETESADDEEISSGDDANSSEDESNYAYNLSDSESPSHCLNRQSPRIMARLVVYCTPKKGQKLSTSGEDRSKQDRRRSSRF